MLSGSPKYPRRVSETTVRLLLPGRGSRAWRCRLSPCPGQLALSGPGGVSCCWLRSSGILVPSGGGAAGGAPDSQDSLFATSWAHGRCG